MNKNALKNFAVDSRKELIEKIKIKAMQYGIEKDKIKNSQIQSSDSIVINGKPLSKDEKQQREKLIEKIKSINEDGGDGYKQVIEEVAYIWFNRFTALRFMEINNYLPTRVRALSSSNPGIVEPELIKEAGNVDLPVDKQKIYEMKLNNDIEGLFKYMIIAQCNDLNKSLPFMFERIGHYTELLFPDGLLNESAFIRRLADTTNIPENNWENVEIIGWLYQYYISEEKDRVIQAKKKYKKDEIPFATQLFTPDWIVKYMVQNSLGRYWVESHPEHSELKKNWQFYLDNPKQEPDFEENLAPYINRELKVEDIKCFDPAMGSGHVLVYMFDVLYEVYEKCGYMSREIPQLIIENNLYGLDIDDRAYQLACFALIMKGMQYNNRLLRNLERNQLRLNLASIQESNIFTDEDIQYIAQDSKGKNYELVKRLIDLFTNAKTYGSLIKVDDLDIDRLEKRLIEISDFPPKDIFEGQLRIKILELLPDIIKQYKIMKESYSILVTNPPYMGSKYMNPDLIKFIKLNYENTKADLFSAFMEYCMTKVNNTGQLGLVTPFVWMFISSYEELRKKLIYNKTISTLIQLEYNAFEAACVPVCAFTLRNYNSDINGQYIKLSEFKGVENQPIKTLEAIKNPYVNYRYTYNNNNLKKINGLPIAYWITNRATQIFEEGTPLGSIASPRKGNSTSNNNRFLRLWSEVDINKVNFHATQIIKEDTLIRRWFPYNKGGGYRKWYGFNEFLIDWKNDAEEIRKIPTAVIANYDYFTKPGLTWSTITSTKFSIRMFGNGYIFDNGGCCLFTDESERVFYLALLNSKVFSYIIGEINPTLNFQSGEVAKFPVIKPKNENVKNTINELAYDCYTISKQDWDSFETSWDFKNIPLLKYKQDGNLIGEAFESFTSFCEKQYLQLKKNEEKINKLFIELYGIENEITPDVDENDITIRKANRERDVKSLISYAIGCMLGRYSLDQEGLIYAGGKFDYSKYMSISVDEDNILPILSDGYFENDIVSRFVDFVKVVFGEETLSENLEYIAETLGKKNGETTKETIRRYFLTDFYKDHLQTYKNRPIYWMFTSGKQKSFNCLIYMHRYDKSTLSRIRTDYLHELQDRLDAERKSLVDVIEGDYTTKEKSEAKKKLTSLDKQIDELKKYDEFLHHMADKQIEINLDDGVVVNYDKFKGLLVKI